MAPKGKSATSRTPPAAGSDRLAVPGAARALAVFEIYARERRGLTKSEIARFMDLPDSSTSDLLDTLRELGYLSRTVTTRQFYPTGRLRDLVTDMPVDGLATFAAEATSLLASRTGETAVFAVATAQHAEIVATTEGSHRLRYVVSPGDTVRLHATSIGKAILSGSSPDDWHHILAGSNLEALTPHTKHTPEAVVADLETGIARGVFQAIDEGTLGVSSLAVSGRVGERIVGLSIIGPTERFSARRDELTDILRDAGKSIFDS